MFYIYKKLYIISLILYFNILLFLLYLILNIYLHFISFYFNNKDLIIYIL